MVIDNAFGVLLIIAGVQAVDFDPAISLSCEEAVITAESSGGQKNTNDDQKGNTEFYGS
jgi:hypothetical protein